MMVPREHGTYGQLLLPLLTAMAMGRPSFAALARRHRCGGGIGFLGGASPMAPLLFPNLVVLAASVLCVLSGGTASSRDPGAI